MYKILDSFVDNIALVNAKGEIIYTNASWKEFALDNLGIETKTGVGVNYLHLCKSVTGEDLQDAKDAADGIQKVIARELNFFEMEYPCHSPNEKRWFLMRCRPQNNHNDHIIISHINITNRKLAEEKVHKNSLLLKEINKRYNTSLYKIVHDIQGPLNSVEGLLNLLKLGNADVYIPLVEKSIANLKDFVKETLIVTKTPLMVEEINFEAIVYDNEDLKAQLGIDIKINIEQGARFFNYKTEVVSVISNMLSNSIKYFDDTKVAPFIEIDIVVNELEAIYTIKDNGIGISTDNLTKIFELNFKANTKKSDGFGVGLNLVKKSLELMHGSIIVNSELGSGTEFVIIIPNLKDHNEFISSAFNS